MSDFITTPNYITYTAIGTTPTTGGSSIQIQTSPSNYTIYGNTEDRQDNKPTKASIRGKISATLYFKYVKSKFSRSQRDRLEIRLGKLAKLQLECKETGQQALLEEVEAALVNVAREQVLLEKGFDRSLDRSSVNKFIDAAANVKQCTLESFPRPIPEPVRKLIARAKGLNVFEKYTIVYTDYTGEAAKKTTAVKVREKDPIIFGIMNCAPTRLYFIADWIDEHCDLTLDKLIEKNVVVDKTLPVLSPREVKNVEARVNMRLALLNDTNISTWRANETTAREAEKPKKRSLLSRVIDLVFFR